MRSARGLRAILWAGLAAFAGTAAPPLAGGERDPFAALASGDASLSVPLERGPLGELRPAWSAAALGGEPVAVGPDATYEIGGAGTLVPARVELVSSAGGTPAGLPEDRASSTAVVLRERDGFAGRAPIDRKSEEPAVLLSLASAAGTRFLSLPDAGQVAPVFALARTPGGEPYGGVLGALDDPAVRIQSSDPSVVEVTASGLAISHGHGTAWIRAFGDGEWTQMRVVVDPLQDTDGDGMPDAFELAHGLDVRRDDAGGDADGDGVSNGEEYLLGTRPDLEDTDGDQLSDAEELAHGTDPLNGDTDGDTSADGIEVFQGSDPLDPNARPSSGHTPRHVATRDLNFWTGTGLAATYQDRVYVLTEDGYVVLYRISPETFFVVRLTERRLGGSLRGIAWEGFLAYVAGASAGVHVLDTQGGTTLQLLATVPVPGGVEAIAVEDGTICAGGVGGLTTLRRNAGGSFEIAGRLAVGTIPRLAVRAGTCFAAVSGSGEVVAIDVRDPASPRVLGRVTLPASTRPFTGMAAAHGALYVAHGNAGLLAVSTADPSALEVVGRSGDFFPGRTFEKLASLGNRLATFAPSIPGRISFFRMLENGGFEPAGDAPAGTADPVLGLALEQEFLITLTGLRFALTTWLPQGDRRGVPPSGRLVLDARRETFAPGEAVAVTAYARDDIHIERVRIFVDGALAADDPVAPFRHTIVPDAARSTPFEIEIRAVGFDLAGTPGEIGTARVLIDRDLDGDGIPDALDRDRDGDGLSDFEEAEPGADDLVSDPERRDTDGDGIEDGEEAAPGIDGFITDPSSADTDGDGLADGFEIARSRTDPRLPDSDGDGVPDGDEDADGDGLAHREEQDLGSDPLRPDTDGDGLGDALERDLGLDPARADTDGDGVADGDEDLDGDSLPNRVEVALGTDLLRADSDGDGLDDGTELDAGTDATAPTDFSTMELVFTRRTVLVGAPLRAARLSLVGSVLTVPVPSPGEVFLLDLEVAGELSIDGASRIDVSGKGFPGGRSSGNPGLEGLGPEGVRPGALSGGGSHGGFGGRAGGSGAVLQETYGDFRAPELPGAGGAATPAGGRGGNGGGAVRVDAAEIVLDGIISAGGEGAPAVPEGGGGAGGAVWLRCEVLRGSGRITANGGAAAAALASGAGGGGRIAIETTRLLEFDTALLAARGGRIVPGGTDPASFGGAGTVVVFDLASERSELIIDNGGLARGGARTPLDGAGRGTIAALGDDFLVRAEGAFPRDVVGLEIDPDAGDGVASAFRIVAQEEDTIWTEPGLLEHGRAGGTFQGILRFERFALRAGGAIATADALAVSEAAGGRFVIAGGDVVAPELRLEGASSLRLDGAGIDLAALSGAAGEPLAEIEATGSRITARGPTAAGALLLRASVLTVPDPASGRVWPLELEIGGLVELDAASSIDLAGKGHAGGWSRGNDDPEGEAPEGAPTGDPGAGGSHGGGGGTPAGGGEAGPPYGVFDLPQSAGGGGRAEAVPGAMVVSRGGDGGGLLRLRAERLILDGAIDASGAPPVTVAGGGRAGAGAGGGIWIETAVLEGSGTVLAAGGSVDGTAGDPGGAGGGGRIAVVAGVTDAFTGALRAPGGEVLPSGPAAIFGNGGAGTVFTATRAGEAGELAADGEGRSPPVFRTSTGTREDGSAVRLRRLAVRGGAFLESEDGLEVEAGDAASPSRFTVAGGLRAPRLALPALAAVEVISGELDVARIEATVQTWTLRGSRWTLHEPLRAGSLQLLGGSLITVPDPTVETVYALDLELTGGFVLETGSAIDLAGKGYLGGRSGGSELPQGQSADGEVLATGGRTGGSHGGLGGFEGAGSGLGTIVAPAYDDFRRPRRPGGGGSGRLDVVEAGYNGGGLLRLQADTAILAGRIDAAGEGAGRSVRLLGGGGGAGGGVWIRAGTIIGQGEIDADGGNAQGIAGCGGGGRIAIHFDTSIGFNPNLHARGGVPLGGSSEDAAGGAGTVFLKHRGQVWGNLTIDNGGRRTSFPRTWLRPVGSGSVEAVEADRLRGDVEFPLSDTRLEGQWVVVGGDTGAPLGIAGNTAAELLIDPAHGDLRAFVAPGASFQGAIVLDNLFVRGAAGFDTRGDLILIATGQAVVEAGASLTAPPVVHW